MTTALATAARRSAVLYSVGDISGQAPKKYRKLFKKDDGTTVSVLVLEDVPVFRSGVFRDSMGYQHTWESLHMDQMVAHFDMLRNRQIFADVPVRDGHPGFLLSGIEGNGKTVGWHTGLKTEQRTNPADGKEYTYLLATYEVLDEDAQKNIDSSLWRNRSSEIGPYVTNDEAEFWPVYQGFAYVDIPAVEGLNGFSKTNPGLGTQFSLMYESDEESPVAVKKHSAGEPVAEGTAPAADEQVETIEVTPDGTVLVDGEVEEPAGDEQVEEPAGDEPVEEPAGDEPVEEPAGDEPVEHGKTKGGFQFRLNGKTTMDFSAVQKHIDSLEGFVKETTDKNRRDFVQSLVDDKKVTGAQQTALEEFALGLDAEQYTAWCGTYTAAPSLTLFQVNAAGVSNTADPANESAAELETAREIIASHARAGMKREDIEKTPSFAKIKQSDPTFTL